MNNKKQNARMGETSPEFSVYLSRSLSKID